ncbi:MAG: Do family serine endopeptidase [Phycisphaerae bacterium]|nr:Do family serine endopeptidase [Phycisphaerae bacterium]
MSSAQGSRAARMIGALVLSFVITANGVGLAVPAGVRDKPRVDESELARVENVSNAFRMVARAAKPAVVYIRVAGGEYEEDEAAELRERLREELHVPDGMLDQFLQAPPPGSGSGVIFDTSGLILTNNHVVENRDSITVCLADEREFEATVVGTDPKTDLAVIRIDAPDLHALPLGDSDKMDVGDWVLAVGAPFGLAQTVTHGIISATGRSRIGGVSITYQDFLQTDATINPGNSGGPLLNLRGEVIGINTAIATRGDAYNAGVAFTIPSNLAKKIARQLVAEGRVRRGWLGIGMADLSQPDVEIFGLKDRGGVLVDGVLEDTPAEKAGLMVEDVILSIDDQPIDNMDHFRNMIADVPPGRDIHLKVVRDGKPRSVKVTLALQPDSLLRSGPTVEWLDVKRIGLRTRTLRARAAEGLGYKPSTRGVVVVDFDPDNQDVAIALSRGDVIIGCNGKPVRTVADLNKALATVGKHDKIELKLVDQDGYEDSVTILRD